MGQNSGIILPSDNTSSTPSILESNVFQLGDKTVFGGYLGNKFLNYICYGTSLLLGFTTISGQTLYDNRGRYIEGTTIWQNILVQYIEQDPSSSPGYKDPDGYTSGDLGYILNIPPQAGIILTMPFQSIDIRVWSMYSSGRLKMDIINRKSSPSSSTTPSAESSWLFNEESIRVGFVYVIEKSRNGYQEVYTYGLEQIATYYSLSVEDQTGLGSLPTISNAIKIKDGGGINYTIPRTFNNIGTSAEPQWVVTGTYLYPYGENGGDPLYLRIRNTGDFPFTIALQNISLQLPIKQS